MRDAIFSRGDARFGSDTLPRIAPNVIGIDEVVLGRAPRTLLIDIFDERLWAILPDQSAETPGSFLRSLQNPEVVDLVSIDLDARLIGTVRKHLPQATSR